VALDDTLTLRQAADLTGLTTRALARRIERGSLPAIKRRDGLRRVKRRDLVTAGLLDPNTDEPPTWSREQLDPSELARQLIDTLTRQAVDLYELRSAVAALADSSERGHAEQAAALELARQEREELRRKIAQMDEDRAALRREVDELRRRRS
jgi:hypothetical protein